MLLFRPAVLLGAALLLAALQGCGQAGDLYLPEEEPKTPPATIQPVVVTPPDAPTTAEPEPEAAPEAKD